MGSLFEFQTQLEIAFNLKFINDHDFNTTFENSRELERILKAYSNKVKE